MQILRPDYGFVHPVLYIRRLQYMVTVFEVKANFPHTRSHINTNICSSPYLYSFFQGRFPSRGFIHFLSRAKGPMILVCHCLCLTKSFGENAFVPISLFHHVPPVSIFSKLFLQHDLTMHCYIHLMYTETSRWGRVNQQWIWIYLWPSASSL